VDARKTHRGLDATLCGRVLELAPGRAVVELAPRAGMAADESGLLHGGFTFGLADHAAMLAVNEPTVVLGSAQVKFLRPTTTAERLVAEATLERSEGKKRYVKVVVRREGEPVFEGDLLCLVPDRHVLAKDPG
jgi:acyl-coenzyme A thioesterase PaaI-like protein